MKAIFAVAAMLLSILAACSPGSPQPTPTPTLAPLEGSVEIAYPLEGTIVYSEAMYFTGTANGVPGSQFTVKLLGPEEETIAQATAQVDGEGRWTVELVHGYSGEPTEMTIIAAPNYAGAPPDADYAVTSVVVAGNAYRPAGAFGSITAPPDGSTLGGDFIVVSGTVSGVFENQFTVALIAEDGTEVASTGVTAMNPNYIDEVPWTAELMTGGYTGPAEIRAFELSPRDGSEILLGSVKVTVTQAAG